MVKFEIKCPLKQYPFTGYYIRYVYKFEKYNVRVYGDPTKRHRFKLSNQVRNVLESSRTC